MMNASAVQAAPRQLFWLWTGLLLGPLAWSFALGALWWLTGPACSRNARAPLLIVGICGSLLAAACSVIAATRLPHTLPDAASGERTRFMLGLAVGTGALFALVIALSTVPVLLLSPCRT